MPTKRDVLEFLKRDELLAAADRLGVEMSDRRSRAVLVDALTRKRTAGLAGILEDLPRTRLKEVCRDLDLDDSGREKATLIARLAGRDGHAPSPKPKPKPKPKAPPPSSRSARPSPAPAPGRLSREALERHLWSAADILRGSIDSSDYKNYILGLLFLKRLSDRFEEECEIVRAEGGNPEDPDEHQFYVPPAVRWERISAVASSIGEEMNKATEALEERNPKLEGVLHGIDYNDERKLGDVKQRDQVLGDLIVHFSEINLRNMLLHGLEHVIEKGDTIREPKLLDEEGNLRQFDLVIANPPFSLDNWGREAAENDSFRRFRFGLPPKSKGDLAFVQHMIAVLHPQRRMAVVMPHGVLFRGGSEGEIRKRLVEEDLIEAIIGLTPKLFFGSDIPTTIVVVNRNKPPERRGRMLLMDASEEFTEGLNKSTLTTKNIERIVNAFNRFETVGGFCSATTLEEVAANEFNLNLTRYLAQSQAADDIDIASAVKRLRAAEMERDNAAATLNRYLRELGYDA